MFIYGGTSAELQTSPNKSVLLEKTQQRCLGDRLHRVSSHVHQSSPENASSNAKNVTMQSR